MRNWIFFLLAALAQSCIVPDAGDHSIKVINKITPLYARGFQLEEMSDSSTRITLFNLEKPGENLQVINWKKSEVNSIACLSTTHIAFVDCLGKMGLLKGVGFSELVKNKNAKVQIENGAIINLTVGHDTDDEKLYAVNPQLFFVYPFGGNSYDKYLAKGIGCVQISEYLENHPLGRAEWIKVFGVLLGEEEKADSIFKQVEKSYNGLVEQVRNNQSTKPTVFAGSYDSGNWFAPPGNSFAARLINDAGGDYIFSDSLSTGNLVIPFESMVKTAFETDFWGKIVHEPGVFTKEKMTDGDERLKNLKAWKEGNLFYCNTAECDYHGDAIMQPEIMLADLISIFSPQSPDTHQPVYFRKVAQ